MAANDHKAEEANPFDEAIGALKDELLNAEQSAKEAEEFYRPTIAAGDQARHTLSVATNRVRSIKAAIEQLKKGES